MESYFKQKTTEGVSIFRLIRYAVLFNHITRNFKLNFLQLTNEQIQDVTIFILNNKQWKQWTKATYLRIFKNFLRYLKNNYNLNINVDLIKIPKVKQGLLPENLITPEEFKKLFDTAETLQQKTLLALLYESGARIGEILTLKVGNVQFNDYGARIKVSGKPKME